MFNISEVINTQENRKLLYQYLTKFYGSEKAKGLMIRYKDNLFGEKGLSYSLGNRSFEYYCLYYLQDFFVPKPTNKARPLAPAHFKIWESLEDMFIKHTHDKQEYILPRGLGKSTIIDMALSCWLHCYKKSIYTLVLANLEADASDFVSKTKKALQTPYIVHTFGELVNSKKRIVNKLELELDNDTKIKAYSSHTSVRGTTYTTPNGDIVRPSVVIADDYISEADILTPEAKVKKYTRWQKEVEESGDEAVIREGKLISPASKFIVIGTPLATGDFIDQIRTNPEYKLFHRSVVDFDIDSYFDENEHWIRFKEILFDDERIDALGDCKAYYDENKEYMTYPTLWDGKYDCYKLAIKYFTKRLAFMQELMCNCEILEISGSLQIKCYQKTISNPGR